MYCIQLCAPNIWEYCKKKCWSAKKYPKFIISYSEYEYESKFSKLMSTATLCWWEAQPRLTQRPALVLSNKVLSTTISCLRCPPTTGQLSDTGRLA